MPTNAVRFLGAFAAIEKHLRAITRLDRQVPFSTVVLRASESSALVRQHRVDLSEYADLRNAIVHERSDGRAIAEPHLRTVVHLERIGALVADPPRVFPAFQRDVQVVDAGQKLKDVLRYVAPKNFSQVPVVSSGAIVGLLTTNTLARWLARQAVHELVDLSDHTVAEALQHTEHDGNWCVVSRNTHLAEVLDRFDEREASGKRLDAILISHSGKPSEGLLGIITIHDMPKVLRLLSTKGSVRGNAGGRAA